MNGFPKRASNPSRASKGSGIVLDLPTVSKMLPLVKQIVADLLSLEQKLGSFLWEREGLDRDRNQLSWPERKRRYYVQDEIAGLEHKRKELKSELEGLGVRVIDSVHGRIGFPTIVNTRPAYFSWQVGEDEVGYWHFAGDHAKRRAIPASWLKETPLASLPRRK
ncbi:MAG: DUF2203 family protein [Gemmataceae bacterium]